ncbi:uncharacterized protein L969DRAFT_100724 [Mixia osmundae IAM 14324]|uniref:Eukaryotic translation initiation factor 3 subunit B n=1 Tax=Mixia osmundae (strain CBS 9802 / IAM 14324 / JCM 22182 / KY 12970) TaxID=764103 RepID=G7E066_MIXOS|nr:uncharacterized protein L969DRAFT_100724 [Mixia osmundae IAM 14324]KEI42216.1 hypothetical protein L969DRAFT_100724 [Mixia osmundae IAM 14324]GAA96226.1 hypothetical protein E5Q_02890 [Mixia osmundae IAM 14324]
MPGPVNGVNGYHAAADEEEIDYSDIEQKYTPHYASPLASAVLIDGAPVVGPERRAKLLSAIQKRFNERGISVETKDMDMPMTEGDDPKSKGLVFVTFATPAIAQNAARALDNFAFDKKHTLAVKTFDDVERVLKTTEEWQDPPEEPYVPKDHLRSWLADTAGRDQVVLYRGDDVQIHWANRTGSLELDHQRQKWTESYTSWSPFGTYFATVHAQGIVLWGGPKFDRVNRFPHNEAKLIDFSPNERYLVTWSPRPIEIPTDPRAPNPWTADDEGNHVCIWDVVTGKLLRSFAMIPDPTTNEAGKRQIFWPMFKWSPDEKYFARITPGQQISVYEAPSMGLIDKKSVKIEGVVDFEWSPMSEADREADAADSKEEAQASTSKAPAKAKKVRENVIAFWVPELQNQPARVSLMALPSRTILRSRNLVSVSDCKLHWQSEGDYLCVKVDRHSKTKKTMFCNLEIFRLREKDFPVEVKEIKDTVTAFAWEPKGSRFVMITSSDPNVIGGAPGSFATSVLFHQLDTRKGNFVLQKTIEKRLVNTVFWSPKGRFVVLATLGSSTKFDLEFWDTELEAASGADLNEPGVNIQLLTAIEEYGMTTVDWDPSGRYVATSGSIWTGSMEPSFALFDFKGNQLAAQTVDKFKQLVWRPRPRTLLTKEMQQKIRRNLREYGRQFEEQDQLEESNVSAEQVALRARLIQEWNAWRRNTIEELEEEREQLGRKPLKDTTADDGALEVVEEWVEEIIDEVEEVVV